MNFKNMDKTTIVNTFLSQVDNLRKNAKLSQKEKMACFQQIAECILSPAMEAHINYATHCSTATNILLLFCEDLDSAVRMSAEENLNRIFRALERTRFSRILMDLYSEIKRNGNQRSLRISLNLFAYYAPRIKEKHVRWYALQLLPCLQTIAQRKETQLCECFCEFMKNFAKNLQHGLTDSETCKLFEVLIASIGVECAVKRRCSAQNFITLIENSRNKNLMAKHGLNKVIELLLTNQEQHSILGALGFLRLLLPIIIRGFPNNAIDDEDEATEYDFKTKQKTKTKSEMNIKNSNKNANPERESNLNINTSNFIANITNECRQIIEIYDYCLHLLSTSNTQQQHGIINASLEVINAILQALDSSAANTTRTITGKSLQQLLSNQQLQHNEYLRKRKSLKNQIFQQFRNYEIQENVQIIEKRKGKTSQSDIMELPTRIEMPAQYKEDPDMHQYIRNSARSISECVEDDMMAIAEAAALSSTTTSMTTKQQYIVDVDLDMEDVEDDDFTTLSEINEPQHTKSTEEKTLKKTKQQTCATTTRIDVDNLIDAIDGRTSIDDNTNVNNKNVIEHTQNLLITNPMVTSGGGDGDGGGIAAALNDDKSSQHLSDFDNESFNSIDFEAEIKIGVGGIGVTGASSSEATVEDTASCGEDVDTKSNSVAIGSFFNNLISHSSAASESVTKLFRPSSASKTITPTKLQTQSDKIDAVSLTSVSAADSLSLISTTSENKRFDVNTILEEESANYTQRQNSNDDSYSRTGSITASTAMLIDNATRNTTAPDCSSNDEQDDDEEQHKIEAEFRRIPNVNPFLKDNSPLKQTVTGLPLITLEIGTIFEQPLLYYTARCIAARFLLTGDSQNRLQNDVTIRVSIKSLSLSVIAQCVRIAPQVLQLPLEITSAELRLLEMDVEIPENKTLGSKSSSASASPIQSKSDHSDSSHLDTEYDHVDDVAGCDLVDIANKQTKQSCSTTNDTICLTENDSLLLDIKDDHFGKSTCDYFLNQPLSRSADPVMLSQQIHAPLLSKKSKESATPPPRLPSKNINTSLLSKSDIVITSSYKSSAFNITESAADTPPPMLPPRPPKRTKSIRKSLQSKTNDTTYNWQKDFTTLRQHENSTPKEQQYLSDILLFYNHLDPMLRSGVQHINGNFLQSSRAGLSLRLTLNLQHLLAILLKGLQDEIHTVIIQALNAFDKIFPHVLSKYLIEPPSCHYPHQWQEQQQRHAEKQTFFAEQVQVVNCYDNAIGGNQQQQQYQQNEKQQHEQKQHQKQHPHTHCTNDMLCTTQGCCCCCRQTSETTRKLLFTDNDELIDALLNTFQLQSKCIDNNNGAAAAASLTAVASSTSNSSAALTSTKNAPSTSFRTTSADNTAASYNHCKDNACLGFFISPKLLLDKLSLCHHNKYWLVQNKYAEVVSNLNYAALRTYYEQNGNANYELNVKDVGNPSYSTCTSEATGMGNSNCCDGSCTGNAVDFVSSDIVCTFKSRFLDEILHLIGDADFRVRSHAAECLCRYIIQNAKQHIPPESDLQNKIPITISTSASASASPISNCNSNNQNGANQKVYCKETFQTNLNLVWDLFDYSIFSGLPTTMRNLFKVNASITPPLMDQISMTGGNANASGNAMTYAEAAMSRNMAKEENVLANVLYRLTNKLMTLNDKHLQFGIIYTLRLLLKHFNFVDFRRAWMEFNFMEICMKFSYYNYTTAVDLNCQYDLIDVTGKLMAGAILVSPRTQQQQQMHQQQIEQLLTHTMKIINIYYHLFTNQKPLLFIKAQKGDLFSNARELAIVQSIGYFGNDYVYIKLYNILRSANDSYKITINPDSGSLLMSLLKICLNTLSLCLELRAHSIQPMANDANASNANVSHPPPNVLKLIEETLQYLTKLINYAPSECIACLRQLLKYLFGQNYGNRQPDYYDAMVRAYFGARVKGQQQQKQQQKQWQTNEQFKCRQNEENETINLSATTEVSAAAAAAAAAATVTVASATSATGAMTMTLSNFEQEQRLATSMTRATATTVGPLQRNLIATHENYAISSGLTTSTSSPLSPGSPLLSLSALSTVPDNRLFAELFVSGLKFHAWRSEREGECARYIKLFERLVIYCLTLFMKSNAQVQAPILELLSQLLDLNVTYSILDSKNVIFEQILKNFETIESGNARNAHILIPPMMKFLVQLTHKSDRKLITIPKIISITNNLLANSTIRDCAVLALKALTYEIFFISTITINSAANTTGITSVSSIAVSAALTRAAPIQLSSSPLSTSSYKPIEQPLRAPFQSPIARSPMSTPQPLSRQQHHNVEETTAAAAIAAEAMLTQQRELDTQKEVILGMLEKFIDANACQQVFCLLLLREQCSGDVEIILELNANKILRSNGSGYKSSSIDVTDEGHDYSRSAIQSMVSILPESAAVYGTICHAMSDGRIRVRDWNDFFILNTIFWNYGKSVLADSKEFLALLQLFIAKDVGDFSDLSYATIILANIIHKTEEIYLVNHIKLYLKNQPMVMESLQRRQPTASRLVYDVGLLPLQDGPSTSSAAAAKAKAAARITGEGSNTISEIKYFAKVLCEKLDSCLEGITGSLERRQQADHRRQQGQQEFSYFNLSHYYRLAVRFVSALYDVCCSSRHKDALKSVFRLVLAESNLLDKYYNLLMMGGDIADGAIGYGDFNIDDGNGVDGYGNATVALMLLQLELFKLLSAVKLLNPLVMLQQIQTVSSLKWNVFAYVRRRLLQAIIAGIDHTTSTVGYKRSQQVLELCSDVKSLSFLIANVVDAEYRRFIYDLCQVDVKLCSLLLSALLHHANAVEKPYLRSLLQLLLRISKSQSYETKIYIEITAKIIAILAILHQIHESSDRLLRLQFLRAAYIIFDRMEAEQQKAIYESLQHLELNDQQLYACFLFLNNVNNLHSITGTDMDSTEVDSCIIDEEWLFTQLIKFSAQSDCDPQQLVKILLEIQSENKLHKIFENEVFEVARVLPHAIAGSVEAMLATFRNDCIQHNPHIHYMRPNPLARVAFAILMARIEMAAPAANHFWEFNHMEISKTEQQKEIATLTHLAKAVIALMESIERIESTALIYIKAKFIEKFVREQMLHRDQVAILLRFLSWICKRTNELLQQQAKIECWQEIRLLMQCIGKMLEQPLIWNELNQIERPTANSGGVEFNILTLQQRGLLLCKLLDLLELAAAQTIQHTLFYHQYKVLAATTKTTTSLMMTTMMQNALSDATKKVEQLNIDVVEGDEAAVAAAVDALFHAYAPKAIFVAKLIETKIDVDATAGILASAYITGSCTAFKTGNSVNSGTSLSSTGMSSGAAGNSSTDEVAIHAEFERLQSSCAQLPLHILETIGISILRTNQFYAYAVTPYEIVQQQQKEQQFQAQSLNLETLTPRTTPERRRLKATKTIGSGKMPTIPVESLSDVDVLRKFVKRLSIFGFTTRQQFEEYFMTFLLLINKVYDENMVDIQEQFHIKSTCLQAILELLITYKTFPIVGNKVSTHFHHTTRWSRINCDSISLKKIHKVQLLIAESNVFYHPNLERRLTATLRYPLPDTSIGTGQFQPNQYDLNFIWQQMEAYAHATISPTGSGDGSDFSSLDTIHDSTGVTIIRDGQNKEHRLSGENNAIKNFRYFTKKSGIDFKSSSQLILDVLMQLIENNHYLVLPNLVKFAEICESRDQIKEIKDRAFRLQESIPMDDTISHQHLIYLLCKTQAMLIPTYGELQQLCVLISTYLKSSHTFIRNATLQGLLCLLECCSKTNTIIGRLSEELTLLRDLILGYINRHGIIDESPIQCSDTHAKLVWTLNYCLIECTTKFVPQCHLVSNTIIAASNFLRKTNNEDIYLCVLHGLERLVVIGNNGCGGIHNATGSGGNNSSSTSSNAGMENAGCIVTPLLRHKIEKLALDLVKLENEKFSIPALKLLLSCMYMGSSKQLENTELSNGIVQDDPEIIAQQTDKVDILLHCIKSSTRDAAWIYGQVLCQIIRDLVPPNEILTKVIKEFLAINQPHCDVIAMIVYQVFRCAIDSSFLQMLQDWLICSLPTFLALPVQKGVWGLSVIFLSASINLHLIKLFPLVVALYNTGLDCDTAATPTTTTTTTTITKTLNTGSSSNFTPSYGATRELRKLGQNEIALFVTAAKDFHAKLSTEQKMRFRDAFKKFQQHKVYSKMLQSL